MRLWKSLFLLWVLLFFLRRKSERADLFPELEVFAVCERGEVGAVEPQLAALVQQGLVDVDVEDIGEEHVMRAERDDLGDAAFQREGRLCDHGAGDLFRWLGGEGAFFEFVDLGARVDAAIVDGADHVGGGEVDDELAAFFDQLVGVALGADGDVGFGRDGVGDARPGDGDDVGGVRRPAGDHHGRDGGDEGTAAPGLF